MIKVIPNFLTSIECDNFIEQIKNKDENDKVNMLI